MTNAVDATVQITVDNEVLETTAEHPFFTLSGWKDAADLTTQDQIKTKDQGWQAVDAIKFLYETKKVYNFEVADWHTYFVGVWAWLVHNARPCLSKIKHLPPWIGRMWKGKYFDFIRGMTYARRGGFNEVVLATGKRLDSYIPGVEIVSRKFTQLSEITAKTAKGYIDEFVDNYAAGEVIKDTARNADAIAQAGPKLKGKMILEVPEQVGKISDEVLEYATTNGIKIRDTFGRIYNP